MGLILKGEAADDIGFDADLRLAARPHRSDHIIEIDLFLDELKDALRLAVSDLRKEYEWDGMTCPTSYVALVAYCEALVNEFGRDNVRILIGFDS